MSRIGEMPLRALVQSADSVVPAAAETVELNALTFLADSLAEHALLNLSVSAVSTAADVLTLRRQRLRPEMLADPRKRAITTLAFVTVAAISIGSYLDLISENVAFQPVNRAMVPLHNRRSTATPRSPTTSPASSTTP
ncbi:hypothetical protein [Rhodococcus opacus]|uniref:hypothetical protein n=1 Tax=Rhodococcus opacus TaxID=37919 RepID=UPI0029549F99|nr:hypothetical protein [Rhodococcus opacus]MDV7088453.1 hypothetical protein [Rhodococcus opacus]